MISSDHTKDMWKTVDTLSYSDLHSNSGVRSDAFNLKRRVDNFLFFKSLKNFLNAQKFKLSKNVHKKL